MKLKIYETVARYLLGIIYLYGAYDGIAYLFFDVYIHGKPPESAKFFVALMTTTWFWGFMKLIQLVGAISLLANYKPALGVALLTPISAILCMFYLFELKWYIAFSVVSVLTIVLLRAYSKSYMHLFDDYPMRSKSLA